MTVAMSTALAPDHSLTQLTRIRSPVSMPCGRGQSVRLACHRVLRFGVRVVAVTRTHEIVDPGNIAGAVLIIAAGFEYDAYQSTQPHSSGLLLSTSAIEASRYRRIRCPRYPER